MATNGDEHLRALLQRIHPKGDPRQFLALCEDARMFARRDAGLARRLLDRLVPERGPRQTPRGWMVVIRCEGCDEEMATLLGRPEFRCHHCVIGFHPGYGTRSPVVPASERQYHGRSQVEPGQGEV